MQYGFGTQLSSCLCVYVHACSDLSLQGQLVGYLDLSQVQGQVKLVLRVSGHGQGLLSEALHRQKITHKKFLTLLFHVFCSVIRLYVKHSGQQWKIRCVKLCKCGKAKW